MEKKKILAKYVFRTNNKHIFPVYSIYNMDDLKKGMIFMKDFFQADNPLIRILECFFDLMELNFLFILTSLPLFTIGSSLCALYNTSIKMIRQFHWQFHSWQGNPRVLLRTDFHGYPDKVF